MAQEKFGHTPETATFTQPYLEGLEAEKPKETELDNCLVLALPVYRDSGKRHEWSCLLHAQPSIFQPDTDIELIATASNEIALQSRRSNLKPGDRVTLTGIMHADTLLFPTGQSKVMYCLALTQAPRMVVKEKRVSTTAYDCRSLPSAMKVLLYGVGLQTLVFWLMPIVMRLRLAGD